PPLPEPPLLARVTETVTATSHSFIFARDFRGGEIIPKAGTVIAQDGVREIRTPHDDCLLVKPTPVAPRGHTAVRLARFETP
ncbi:MAG: peptidase M14, partial [Alphaproteobacteria bacterium]